MSTSVSIEDQDLVEQTLKDGFRLLRFPEALERLFVQHHAEDRHFKLGLAGLNAVLVYGLILVTAYLTAPTQIALTFGLQIGSFGPIVLLSLFVLRRTGSPALNEWLVVPVTLAASAIVAFQSANDTVDLSFTKVVELISIVIYASVFTRFWPMVLMALALGPIYLHIVFTASDVIGANRIGSCLTMMTVSFYALYGCYIRERNDRLSFLLDQRETALRHQLGEANRQLGDAARTDPLTGIANRRAFDEALSQHARFDAGHRLGLLLIDVDHFKLFNDRYGHQAGDLCLCMVSDAIASCLRRPDDLLARWGGEEFAVLLFDTDQATASQIADRICRAVAARHIPHATSSCATTVTVSIGHAVIAMHGGEWAETLLKSADEALYRAKSQGRNRSVPHKEVAFDAEAHAVVEAEMGARA